MIAYKAIDVPRAVLSPGDYFVIAGQVIRNRPSRRAVHRSVHLHITKGPVLRLCNVDYALNNGLITTSGYIDGSAPGHAVTLVVTGGTGAYRAARGYGTLRPTPAGSDVTLQLTG